MDAKDPAGIGVATLQKKFQDLLHQYKVQVFHNEHDQKNVEKLTQDCLHITEDVLKQNFHFHFNKLADANRAEIINMINNYVRDAILPPVVEKLVERQVRLERRFNAMFDMQRQMLELLSQEAPKESVGR